MKQLIMALIFSLCLFGSSIAAVAADNSQKATPFYWVGVSYSPKSSALQSSPHSMGEYRLVQEDGIDYIAAEDLPQILDVLMFRMKNYGIQYINNLKTDQTVEYIVPAVPNDIAAEPPKPDDSYVFNFETGVISHNGETILSTHELYMPLKTYNGKGYIPVFLTGYLFFGNNFELAKNGDKYYFLNGAILNSEIDTANFTYYKPGGINANVSDALKKASLRYFLLLFQRYYPSPTRQWIDTQTMLAAYDAAVSRAKDNASYYNALFEAGRKFTDLDQKTKFCYPGYANGAKAIVSGLEDAKYHNKFGEGIDKLDSVIEIKELDGDTGYLYVPSFTLEQQDFASRIDEAVKQFRDKQAVIVDIRGNAGGDTTNYLYLLGSFAADRFVLDNFAGFAGELKLKRSSPDYFRGKLILLTDKFCYGAANFLTAGFKTNKMGVSIGEKTGGVNYQPGVYILPDNTLVKMADYLIVPDKNGNNFESGVEPDIAVENKLVGGKDAILERAMEYSKSNQ